MHSPSLIVLIAVLGINLVSAAEYKLPSAKPVVRIDLEESWKPEQIPRGWQAQSADGGVFVAVEAAGMPAEMTAIIDGFDATLKARKVTLDRTSRKDSKFKINEFPAEELIYTGADSKGPVTVSFTFVTLPATTVVFTYWASAKAHVEHQPEIGKIFDSVRAIRSASLPVP